jgi:hypothetical protein
VDEPRLTVVDHTSSDWSARYEERYVRRGRENGAATYSREIVEHHVPVWEQYAPPGTILSTCAPLVTPPAELDGRRPALVVQYLHAYPYHRPTTLARKVHRQFPRVLFVTAYRALHRQLRAEGMGSIFVPMAIDVDQVRAAAGPPARAHGRGVALYFGNVTKAKRDEYQALSDAFKAEGWRLDLLSDGQFKGEPVTQARAWGIASGYDYGVGVGRCALELYALGLRVMVSGAEFGGLVTTDAEWGTQVGCNFNGRVVTFDRDRNTCVRLFDQAMVRPASMPVSRAVAQLQSGLRGLSAQGWFSW